ncbi:MAG: snoRNA-binding protein [Tremellales sp. Tagirdzhanova-0007]|nr:MAG: snoRNA-binding protein [Tremellales sp. Tagirdzhanova-0007]
MSEVTPKKEKKEKKRKSEAAVEPDVVPPEQGSASAEAVMMEVDGEKAVKKSKKEKRKSLGGDGEEEEKDKKPEFLVPLDAISPIASPLAGKKLSKKLFRTVKRASKARQLKRGVKEVVKALRKGEKGLLLLASNITPVDVISHLPLMAEEAPDVEYCWVLSKEELGAASGTKRATSTVQKRPTPKDGTPAKSAPTAEEVTEWKEGLEECMAEARKLEHPSGVRY